MNTDMDQSKTVHKDRLMSFVLTKIDVGGSKTIHRDSGLYPPTCKCTRMQMYTVQVYTCTSVHMYKCTHGQIHVYKCTHVRTHVHVYKCTCVQIYTLLYLKIDRVLGKFRH